jgi:hypothetical protein
VPGFVPKWRATVDKIGTIVSPWRYDVVTFVAPRHPETAMKARLDAAPTQSIDLDA